MKHGLVGLLMVCLFFSCTPVYALESAADYLKKNSLTSSDIKKEPGYIVVDSEGNYVGPFYSTRSECIDKNQSKNCAFFIYKYYPDGLYEDPNIEGRYIYRGKNPDNYIKLGNDMYRIVSIERDGSLKVMSTKEIYSEHYPWDSYDHRFSENSSDYCSSSKGCNIWGNNSTMLDKDGNYISSISNTSDGVKLNLPVSAATLNEYLNGEWYNQLSLEVKNLIIDHDWNVGFVSENEENLATTVEEEALYKWRGKVALIGVSDFINSGSNLLCQSVYSYQNSRLCLSNNDGHSYLDSFLRYALLNPVSTTHENYDNDHNVVWMAWDGLFVRKTGDNGFNGYTYSSYPTFYIKPNIVLARLGTVDSPFEVQGYIEDSDESSIPSDTIEVPSTSKNLPIIIVVSGICCIILGLIIGFYVFKKKKVKEKVEN